MAEKRAFKSNVLAPLNLEMGKIPPQAIELEEIVLGAVMLEKDAIIEVIDILKPESFYKEEHQKIFGAVIDLFATDKAIDLLTVTEQLRVRKQLEEVGGPLYVTQLTSRVASAAHIDFHARIVQQKFIQRELVRVASEIQNKAFDESTDIHELISFSEGELFKVAEGNIKKEVAKMNVLLKEAIMHIDEASKRDDGLSGIPSGFTKLDRITSGWQRANLIIIAARPAMGKTAFVLSMARNMAVEHKKPVAIFSLEMSSLELVNRLIVSETEIHSNKIKNGELNSDEWVKLNERITTLEDAPIYIDDTPAISVFELRAKCRRMKRKHDIEAIIIDYLQLMTGPPETRSNREQEVSTISRTLKSIAKELNIPVIALSQLNRGVEGRTGYEGKRPQLSDLRESGAIEQDADAVMFIHRPEYYGFIEDPEGNSLKGVAEIILAKHRHGAIGDVSLRFQGEFVKFVELESEFLSPLDSSSNSPSTMTFESKMNQGNNDNFPLNNDLEGNADFSSKKDLPF